MKKLLILIKNVYNIKIYIKDYLYTYFIFNFFMNKIVKKSLDFKTCITMSF